MSEPLLEKKLTTNSESETLECGRAFAESLQPGDVVCVSGQLGAGKTVFCRGVCLGLGVDPDDVSSPSFSIVNEYRGECDVLHVDFYRLSGSEEIERIGWSDYLERKAVMLIEWPEIAESALPEKRIVVSILRSDSTNDSLRRITITRENHPHE